MNDLIDTDFMNVLLIDDDPTFRFIVRTISTNSGLARIVQEAENGSVALEYIRGLIQDGGELPDMIVLDLNMPVMNGWEFLDLLPSVATGLTSRLPVFILTSSINVLDREKSNMYESVLGMFPKPLTPLHLEKMRESLGE